MELNSLNTISPIDGRYAKKCRKLSKYFSEESLIKYRVLIEIEYFLALTRAEIYFLNDLPKSKIKSIKNLSLIHISEPTRPY